LTRTYCLPLFLILLLAQATCGADWLDISGTVIWSKVEAIPERPIVDVSQFTKQVHRNPNEIREFGWIIDPDSRAVASVVVFVRNPKRIHPDFPQDARETKKAFSSFFQTNVGVPLDEIKSVSDLPAEASLEAVPSLAILSKFNCQPTTMAIRAGQPVVIVNKDDVVYNLQFFGSTNVSQFCNPNEIKSHYFADWTQNSVGCTIHPWMNLPVSVFDHPYFGTTDSHGRFCINRVPAGEVELCALFSKYSIDLGSGQIAYTNVNNVRLRLTANSDIDLGTISISGWPLKENQKGSDK
jgi:hypothetical protein